VGKCSYAPFSKCVTHYDTFNLTVAKMSWALRGAKNTFEKVLSALSTKLYYFPKKEHCKVAGVPVSAILQP